MYDWHILPVVIVIVIKTGKVAVHSLLPLRNHLLHEFPVQNILQLIPLILLYTIPSLRTATPIALLPSTARVVCAHREVPPPLLR
jgi:hypothetical protein